jgi:hypothetical protein
MKEKIKRIEWQYAARCKSDPAQIIAQATDLRRLRMQLDEKRTSPAEYFISRLLPPNVIRMV